ncbi:MAG: pirin family protein [Deltaproteobacteria bacterium]|nr:pirin family protein [Deltaproteobacteria bacterium]
MGNKGVIESGDVQWMTAGSGIIHQEMPRGDDDGLMWGFQFWANLPAARKMMDPRYRGITAGEIPEVTLPGDIRAKVICGELAGVMGPVRDVVINPEYLDVTVPPDTTFTHPIRRGHKAFAYVVDGTGYFDPERNAYAHEVVGTNYFDLQRPCSCSAENLILYGDGDAVAITTQERPVRFLLVSGQPIGEPVAWYGPIVMNTQEELQIAFEEYEKGTFIKYK